MATIPLTNVLHARIQMRTNDAVHSIGINYNCSSGYDPVTSSTQLAAAVLSGIVPSLIDVLSEDTTIEGVYVTHSLPETALPFSLALNSLIGAEPTGALPPNSCAVYTLASDEPELTRPGRVYVGGLSKGDLENGGWETSFVNGSMTALATALEGQITSAGQDFDPVVVRRQGIGVPGLPFAVAVNVVRVTEIVYSQRRRTTKQYGTSG